MLRKKVLLYRQYPKEHDLTGVDRIMLENKKKWQISHLLGLKEHEETINKSGISHGVLTGYKRLLDRK